MNDETAIVVTPAETPLTLFGTDDPAMVVQKATAVAKSLADVIKDRKLYRTISNRPYTFLEGWTLLGSMLGVFGEVEWSRPIPNGFEARVVVRNLRGQVLGAAESQCTRDEAKWSDRDDYALRSMAQTRAASKALRLPLGFIMVLAGYEATPAEEMVEDRKPARKDAPAGPSLDAIKTRLLDRAAEHGIEAARLDELIKQYVPPNPDPDTLRAKLIELGTDITRGMFDAPGASGDAVAASTPTAEQMSADEAIAAGAALVGKS